MGVNSAFKGFFNNRLAVGSGVAIVMLFCFGKVSATGSRCREANINTTLGCVAENPLGVTHSSHGLLAKRVNLIVRQIGHRLLLQSGDSTSRVLPVTEIKAGTFLLKFENEFVFNHDSLMVLSQGLLPKTQFPSGYTVTVHECVKDDIVYGFQINNTSPDILPCRGRSQPSGCYIIEFSFPDFYESVEQKKAEINQLPKELKSFKADFPEANPKIEGFKRTIFDNDIDQLKEEIKSSKVDLQDANPTPEELKNQTIDYPFISLVSSGILVLLSVALLIGRFKRSLIPVSVQNQHHDIIKESVPEVPALGKFLFDVKDQHLVRGSEVISLTEKECRILELLNKNFGELTSRETLMQKIWIDEGIITGRSLDMFVSKLRKKLSSDPELRITNVHGKGYKLEIAGTGIKNGE
jgi:DNA-binding winged helix-turn-helix (wHTH) protein